MAFSRRPSHRGPGRLRRFGSAHALGAVIFLLSGQAAAVAEPPPGVTASVENDLLTLEAHGVSRDQVLHAIAIVAGFRVVLAETGDEAVSLSLSRVPMERAVLKLLRGSSAVLVYTTSPGQDRPRLSEVRMLRSAGDRAAESLSAAEDGMPVEEERPEQWLDSEPGDERAARLRTVRSLAGRADDQAMAALAHTIEHDGDSAVRRAAVESVRKMRVPKARAALIAALVDEDKHVRRRAIGALERTWGANAVASLGRVLAEDSDPAMRRLAAESLGRIGGVQADSALLEAQSDPEPSVRQAATAALDRQAPPGF